MGRDVLEKDIYLGMTRAARAVPVSRRCAAAQIDDLVESEASQLMGGGDKPEPS